MGSKVLEQGFLRVIRRIVEDADLNERVLCLAGEGNLVVFISNDSIELLDRDSGELLVKENLGRLW